MSSRSDLRPLRSADDHLWALAEIEKVIGSDYDSPDGERLELLSILVDAYEADQHPILAPTPEQARDFAHDQGRRALPPSSSEPSGA